MKEVQFCKNGWVSLKKKKCWKRWYLREILSCIQIKKHNPYERLSVRKVLSHIEDKFFFQKEKEEKKKKKIGHIEKFVREILWCKNRKF